GDVAIGQETFPRLKGFQDVQPTRQRSDELAIARWGLVHLLFCRLFHHSPCFAAGGWKPGPALKIGCMESVARLASGVNNAKYNFAQRNEKSMSEVLREDLADGVLLLRINRPEVKNALNQAVREQLAAQ